MSYIPKKLTIFLHGETTVSRDYGMPEEAKVRPAWVCDTNKPKNHETAKRWAKDREWDRESKTYISKDYEVVERDNEPFDGLRVFSLNKQHQGTSKYKVIDPWGHFYDIREEEFLSSILLDGMKPGGVLPGHWIWGVQNVGMCLILVDGPTHMSIRGEMMERVKKYEVKRISSKDLEIGGVYDGSNQPRIYMGRARYRGKLMFIWIDCCRYREPQIIHDEFASGERERERWSWRSGRGTPSTIREAFTPYYMLTSSHNARNKTAQIENPQWAKNGNFRFRDGNSQHIPVDEVEIVSKPDSPVTIGDHHVLEQT